MDKILPVSYTHLDVYKRQLCIQHCKSGNPKITEKCDEDGREGSDG